MSSLRLEHYPRHTPIETLMGSLAVNGGVIVHDFIDSGLLRRLNTELDAHIEATGAGSDLANPEAAGFWGKQTKRFTRLAARTRSFAELLDHDLMHQWAGRALENGYWLNTGQAMIIGPGEKRQELHRDLTLWPLFVQAGKDAPEAMVSILLALSDFTEEVGATRVVLGSHRWDDFNRIADPTTAVPAVMPAGSALMYLGKTIHGAGANRTAATWRRGLHMSFVLGWLAPEEASPIAVPWEIAQIYSPRVQQMLGFVSPVLRPELPPYGWLVDFKDVRSYVNPPK